MNKEYKEPMFKVVITSAQDVLTASETYVTDPFESDMIPLD